jgi:hypothetical protein
MPLLTQQDIYSRDEYEAMRPALRRRMLTHKAPRRIEVGPHCTVLFESYETMHYQVHEMLRAENNWQVPDAIAAELNAYNPLIPGHGELSATVMFEYTDEAQRQVELRHLVGIERHLWLTIGDTPPILAIFAEEQMDADKISSVQYARWRLNDEQRQLLKQEGTVIRLSFDHPHYRAQSILSESSRQAIMNDPD